jgi:ketosteroid isomerase-like protein
VTVETQLRAAYDHWFEAAMAGDPEPFNEMVTDDWVYTDIFGAVWDKAGYLDLIKSLAGTGLVMKLTDLTARPHGDLALVTGEYVVEGLTSAGKDLSSETRFTALWTNSGGRWRSLAHHATRRA